MPASKIITVEIPERIGPGRDVFLTEVCVLVPVLRHISLNRPESIRRNVRTGRVRDYDRVRNRSQFDAGGSLALHRAE